MRHGKRSGARAGIVLAGLLAAGTASAAGDSVQIVPDPLWLLVLLILFALLIGPLNRILFKPLFAVLDERERRIAGARARAAEVQQEAESVLSRYETEVARTREDSSRSRRDELERARAEEIQVTGEARGGAELKLEDARREIGAALEEARGALRPRAEELAREAAQRILGRELA